MKNKILQLKDRKVTITIIMLVLIITGLSFYQYYEDYFSYSPKYYQIKKECYINKKSEYCSYFKSEKDLDRYIINNDPVKKYKKLDAVTLTCEIVENGVYSILQFLSPLLIIILVFGQMHSEINSGMFKYYLLRMEYKKYLHKLITNITKVALIIPISLAIIFIASCIITKFNFVVDDSTKMTAVYDAWKYNNFILYGFFICALQYLLSLFYGFIAMVCMFKNKNSLIGIIMSYITFLIVDIFLYVVIYAIILVKIFGLSNLAEYFSITGYWFFNVKMNYILLFIIAIILNISIMIVMYKKLTNKEEVLLENAKHNA